MRTWTCGGGHQQRWCELPRRVLCAFLCFSQVRCALCVHVQTQVTHSLALAATAARRSPQGGEGWGATHRTTTAKASDQNSVVWLIRTHRQRYTRRLVGRRGEVAATGAQGKVEL